MKYTLTRISVLAFLLASVTSGIGGPEDRALEAFPFDTDSSIEEGKLRVDSENQQHKIYIDTLVSQGKIDDFDLLRSCTKLAGDDKFFEWLKTNPDQRRIFSSVMAGASLRYLEKERQKGTTQWEAALKSIEKTVGHTKSLPTLDPVEFKGIVDRSIVVQGQAKTLKHLMNQGGLPHEIDKDGDATVVFNYTDVKRKQEVWIGRNLTEVGNYKLRKIFSYAYNGEKAPGASAMAAALKDNNAMDTSRWSITHSEKDGRYVVMLTALVPEIADAQTVVSIVKGVASRADKFEK